MVRFGIWGFGFCNGKNARGGVGGSSDKVIDEGSDMEVVSAGGDSGSVSTNSVRSEWSDSVSSIGGVDKLEVLCSGKFSASTISSSRLRRGPRVLEAGVGGATAVEPGLRARAELRRVSSCEFPPRGGLQM